MPAQLVAFLLLICAALQINGLRAVYRNPFTHDFKKSTYDWRFQQQFWTYSGQDKRFPNTTNIPSFYNDGNYFWTQTKSTLNDLNFLHSPRITNVERTTRFYFRYWFYSPKSNSDDALIVYFRNLNTNHAVQMETVTADSDRWSDITVDCQQQNCCDNAETCDIEISIAYEFSCAYVGQCLAAIRCVSTEANGCGDLPAPSMSGKSPWIQSDPSHEAISVGPTDSYDQKLNMLNEKIANIEEKLSALQQTVNILQEKSTKREPISKSALI